MQYVAFAKALLDLLPVLVAAGADLVELTQRVKTVLSNGEKGIQPTDAEWAELKRQEDEARAKLQAPLPDKEPE